MSRPKRILICPLNWGLGHAGRDVPIIRMLSERGAEVVIAASGGPLAMLREEFPDMEWVGFPSFSITYPARGSMTLKMMFSAPGILRGIRTEHNLLEKIIAEKKIDAVISDNRFGLWTQKVPCVFITHQMMIKMPDGIGFVEGWMRRKNLRYINKYSKCWIPDLPGELNLSGDLSHKYPLPANAAFIGTLSRFNTLPSGQDLKEIYKPELLAVLSGPEPQRTIFEEMLISQLTSLPLQAVIIRGLPGSNEIPAQKNIRFLSHLKTDELRNYLAGAKNIVCRPGYSSLMDLVNLGKTAIIVPTPGQTEQEYLGRQFKINYHWTCQSQKTFCLKEALENKEASPVQLPVLNNNLLAENVSALLSMITGR